MSIYCLVMHYNIALHVFVKKKKKIAPDVEKTSFFVKKNDSLRDGVGKVKPVSALPHCHAY